MSWGNQQLKGTRYPATNSSLLSKLVVGKRLNYILGMTYFQGQTGSFREGLTWIQKLSSGSILVFRRRYRICWIYPASRFCSWFPTNVIILAVTLSGGPYLRYNLPSWQWSPIPPNGKAGKSSTQVGAGCSSQEDIHEITGDPVPEEVEMFEPKCVGVFWSHDLHCCYLS